MLPNTRVGEKCIINDRDAFIEYNADLKTFKLLPRQITARYQDFSKTASLIYYGSELAAKGLELQFYISGETEDQTQISLSNLLIACQHCVIRKENSDFRYPAVLLAYDIEDTEVNHDWLITLTFAVVQQKALVSVDFEDSGEYINYSNAVSGCIYRITPTKAISSLTIDEITVKNLAAHEALIIDGIHKKVTADGVNRFGDTDISEFPTTKPGQNRLILSLAVPVTVQYYPTYL